MTILRASRILLALYYRLLEHMTSDEAIQLVSAISCTDLVSTFKDKIIDLIIPDIVQAYKEIKQKHKISFGGGNISEEAVCFIEMALGCHREVEQEIGY